jgi:hypothetical protein
MWELCISYQYAHIFADWYGNLDHMRERSLAV